MYKRQQFSNSQLGVNITDAWFIHYEKGGFVAPHAHGDCSWCCVYYIQLGEDASKKMVEPIFKSLIQQDQHSILELFITKKHQ